jgi:hypothetical protein
MNTFFLNSKQYFIFDFLQKVCQSFVTFIQKEYSEKLIQFDLTVYCTECRLNSPLLYIHMIGEIFR